MTQSHQPDRSHISPEQPPSPSDELLHVECIDSLGSLQALETEWRTLYDLSEAANPFATYDWAVCWWKHLRHNDLLLRDSLAFRAMRDSAGSLVAIAPIVRTDRPAIGPIRAIGLQFLGADANITEIRGLITLPGYEDAAYAALLDDLKIDSATRTNWDWIDWNGLSEGEGAGRVCEQPSYQPLRNVSVSLLALAPTWEEFSAKLKRNIRESLRRCYNSLRREGIEFNFRVYSSQEDIDAALERFFTVHSARAKLPAPAVRHADVFGPSAARRFLKDVCSHLAQPKAGSATRVFEIEIAGKVVASRIGFQFADTLYLYYSGYDPAWARYSIMTTLVAEAIRYAIDQRLKTVNLSTGLDAAKTRWGPKIVTYGRGCQVAPGLRAANAYLAYQLAYAWKTNRES